VKRRLAAVLAADVASYSRFIGPDEERPLAGLKVVGKDLVNNPTIAARRGRFVKPIDGGMLLQFE
jgi:adenylate cyclase